MTNEPIREAMYDEEQLASFEEEETGELIAALAAYCKRLEEQVIHLRRDVNRLTPQGHDEPFPDLHSDLYETFDHWAACARFQHLLTELE